MDPSAGWLGWGCGRTEQNPVEPDCRELQGGFRSGFCCWSRGPSVFSYGYANHLDVVEPTGKKNQNKKNCKQSDLKVGRKGRSQGSHLAPEVSLKTGMNWVSQQQQHLQKDFKLGLKGFPPLGGAVTLQYRFSFQFTTTTDQLTDHSCCQLSVWGPDAGRLLVRTACQVGPEPVHSCWASRFRADRTGRV